MSVEVGKWYTIDNLNGSYPERMVMDNGQYTEIVSVYFAYHKPYSTQGLSKGSLVQVIKPPYGENLEGVVTVTNNETSLSGRSDWYIHLLESNLRERWTVPDNYNAINVYDVIIKI